MQYIWIKTLPNCGQRLDKPVHLTQPFRYCLNHRRFLRPQDSRQIHPKGVPSTRLRVRAALMSGFCNQTGLGNVMICIFFCLWESCVGTKHAQCFFVMAITPCHVSRFFKNRVRCFNACERKAILHTFTLLNYFLLICSSWASHAKPAFIIPP